MQTQYTINQDILDAQTFNSIQFIYRTLHRALIMSKKKPYSSTFICTSYCKTVRVRGGFLPCVINA